MTSLYHTVSMDISISQRDYTCDISIYRNPVKWTSLFHTHSMRHFYILPLSKGHLYITKGLNLYPISYPCQWDIFISHPCQSNISISHRNCTLEISIVYPCQRDISISQRDYTCDISTYIIPLSKGHIYIIPLSQGLYGEA